MSFEVFFSFFLILQDFRYCRSHICFTITSVYSFETEWIVKAFKKKIPAASTLCLRANITVIPPRVFQVMSVV